jgi:hypothetical protein
MNVEDDDDDELEVKLEEPPSRSLQEVDYAFA